MTASDETCRDFPGDSASPKINDQRRRFITYPVFHLIPQQPQGGWIVNRVSPGSARCLAQWRHLQAEETSAEALPAPPETRRLLFQAERVYFQTNHQLLERFLKMTHLRGSRCFVPAEMPFVIDSSGDRAGRCHVSQLRWAPPCFGPGQGASRWPRAPSHTADSHLREGTRVRCVDKCRLHVSLAQTWTEQGHHPSPGHCKV